MTTAGNDAFLDDLLAALDLEQKVRLLTGRDFWTTWPIEEIGLRAMVVSDGPSGVRGQLWDERDPSINLPSASCLSASWDPTIARRYGNVAATEARRKGIDVVLGPTVNIHRSPLGGRHFEAYSEDPRLTAELATAVVEGLQENGVGACPKHYVANDSETDRMSVSVEVSDRALREIYLLAFERPVVDAGAWTVMSAYNSINGATATEHELLETPLSTEWGFDGVVISDWTAVRSLDSARACQDLVMPGPKGPWGDALLEAVRNGDIAESVVDRKVRRLLLLAARVGALAGVEPAVPQPLAVEDGVAFAREAAIEGSVLVRNDGLLPLAAPTLSRVAVIGHNAIQARTQGGGSATVLPEKVVSPLEGLREALPGVEVTHALGAVVSGGVAELPLEQMTNPVTGDPGARVRFLDAAGREVHGEDRRSTALVYFGGAAPIATARTFELSTLWTPEVGGPLRLGFAAVGTGRIHLDGGLVSEVSGRPDESDPASALLSPPSATIEVEVEAGRDHEIRVVFDLATRAPNLGGAFAITVGIEPAPAAPETLLAEAAAAADAADVAIVVVGTNSVVESEGYDRSDLVLPGRQDDLVRAVAGTGTPTVVVVNSGSPVELPWRDDVGAVLLSWFGGQQMGQALADIVTGAAEPGGRLPTTWPARTADAPILDTTPVDGKLAYDEGVHVGYRAWLRTGTGTEPAYPFGHGLGYTTWSLTDLDRTSPLAPGDPGEEPGDVTVELTVTNTGDRSGKQVVQAYLSRPDSGVDRPVRWLAAHTVVRLGAGERVRVAITIPARAFAHWDEGWHHEPGRFRLAVGTSVAELPLSVDIDRGRNQPQDNGRDQT
jgi:beta-glucosidase